MDNAVELPGYRMEKIRFNMLWVNIFVVIVLLVFTALLGGPFYLIWGEFFTFTPAGGGMVYTQEEFCWGWRLGLRWRLPSLLCMN